MEDNSFIIDTMKWSFSRISSFISNCKREWKIKYIDKEDTCDSFDGQCGTVAHKVLEKYFKDEIDASDMSTYFEELYKNNVTMPCPYKNGDTKYNKILDYFNHFSFDKNKYEILGVEKKIEFKIGEYDCIGYVDLLYREKETGEITICDHKSSTIKILKSGKISKSDQTHFLDFKRQLYLYSKQILEEYQRVDHLKWNMYKDGTTIEIPWDKAEYEDTIQWGIEIIKEIEKETEFSASPDWYYCSNLCSIRQSTNCPYRRLGLIYSGIYSKCYNPKNKDYPSYGGCGIEMFEDWKNDREKFFSWALENGYEDNLILKRYDDSQGYDFFNCYWDRRCSDDEYYNPEE